MRSTQPIVPLNGPLMTLTKSPGEKTLRTLYQETTSVPSSVERSTSKWVYSTAAMVASFSEETRKTRSPCSKVHSSGGGKLVPTRAGCEESLTNLNIRQGTLAELREIECKSIGAIHGGKRVRERCSFHRIEVSAHVET